MSKAVPRGQAAGCRGTVRRRVVSRSGDRRPTDRHLGDFPPVVGRHLSRIRCCGGLAEDRKPLPRIAFRPSRRADPQASCNALPRLGHPAAEARRRRLYRRARQRCIAALRYRYGTRGGTGLEGRYPESRTLSNITIVPMMLFPFAKPATLKKTIVPLPFREINHLLDNSSGRVM